MGQKKTIKLVKKVLNEKSHLYSDAELLYMEKAMDQMILERARKKLNKKQTKGFGYGQCETDLPHNGSGES